MLKRLLGRVPTLDSIMTSPRGFARAMSIWPPYLAAGVRVVDVAEDWTSITVQYRINRVTGNYFGTAFGGTQSAMTDPFFLFMVMNQLGGGYIVWDTQGHIDFRSPGKGVVTAHMQVPPAETEAIRAEAADGRSHRHWFECDITNPDGSVVAVVKREVYIKKKPPRA